MRRKDKVKGCPIPGIALTLDRDMVPLGDLFCDREAKPAAAFILLGAFFMEPVKDIGNFLGQDAASAI